jgi:esterase/lipase superfamily enzyme
MRRFIFWPWLTGVRGFPAACVRGSRLPPHRYLLIVIAVCGLAGCAAPKGVLVPVVARAPGTSEVEMLVATTRAPTTPAEMFSGYRGSGLDFADIVVSMPPVHQPGNVEIPHQIPGDPATDFVTLKANYNDRSQALATFRRLLRTTPKRQVLVFVHGFNNRFEEAVFRFAQFVHDSGVEGQVVPVLFTWPSKGGVLAYGYDRESVEYSRDELESGLRFLAKDPEVGEITVLAHSMGNWVTLEALRQMAIRDGKVARKIHNVILAAPDVGVDVAYKQIDQIYALGARRPKFVLITSEDDRALAISRRVWGQPRLGSIDPNQQPDESKLRREGIEVIDATKFRSSDPFHHGKFAENPQLVSVIGQIVTPGQSLTGSRVSLGEKILQTTAGATASVGHAAGLVLTAPVAIVDPLTREQYGDQVDAFGQSVRDAVTPQ